MNIAKLVSITPKAEETIAYIARVSNPKNQENEKYLRKTVWKKKESSNRESQKNKKTPKTKK